MLSPFWRVVQQDNQGQLKVWWGGVNPNMACRIKVASHNAHALTECACRTDYDQPIKTKTLAIINRHYGSSEETAASRFERTANMVIDGPFAAEVILKGREEEARRLKYLGIIGRRR